MKPVRILLVDDHPTIIDAIKYFFSHSSGCEIVGTANDEESALAQVRELHPDIILLDIQLSGMNGIEIIPKIRNIQPGVGIIILTMFDLNAYREAAQNAKVNGYVLKKNIGTNLLPEIVLVAQQVLAKNPDPER